MRQVGKGDDVLEKGGFIRHVHGGRGNWEYLGWRGLRRELRRGMKGGKRRRDLLNMLRELGGSEEISSHYKEFCRKRKVREEIWHDFLVDVHVQMAREEAAFVFTAAPRSSPGETQAASKNWAVFNPSSPRNESTRTKFNWNKIMLWLKWVQIEKERRMGDICNCGEF